MARQKPRIRFPSTPGGALRIVVAPASFKGSLGAVEAAEAIAAGVRRACHRAEVVVLPVADGGEGTARVLARVFGGERIPARVTGPLGDPVDASWTRLANGVAVVELAEAAGLGRVPAGLRDPTRTTTTGFGELLRAALDGGARDILASFGGSVTCDGGAGALAALGVRLLDAAGRPIVPTGAGLAALARVDAGGLDQRLRPGGKAAGDVARLTFAVDVVNPMCGPEGAARVFGPQKGAGPAEVALLDANLEHFCRILRRDLGVDVSTLPGGGAAGGAAGGLHAVTAAALASGIELVLDRIGFDGAVRGAFLVVTGEGCLDGQTLFGKAVAGVAARSMRHHVPVVALAGRVEEGVAEKLGLLSARGINPPGRSPDEAMARAAEFLEATAAEVVQETLYPRHQAC